MNLREFSELQSLAHSLATLRKSGRLGPKANTPPSPASDRPQASVPSPVAAPPDQVSVTSAAPVEPRSTVSPEKAVPLPKVGDVPPSFTPTDAPSYVVPAGKSLSEKLGIVLATFCQRAGLSGALLTDSTGLPLATHRCESDITAACGAMLGQALDQTNRILHDAEANDLVLELDNGKKMRLRRFRAGSNSFYLLVLYEKSGADRNEIDLAVAQLVPILSKPALILSS